MNIFYNITFILNKTIVCTVQDENLKKKSASWRIWV